jgi:hypothetical protein
MRSSETPPTDIRHFPIAFSSCPAPAYLHLTLHLPGTTSDHLSTYKLFQTLLPPTEAFIFFFIVHRRLSQHHITVLAVRAAPSLQSQHGTLLRQGPDPAAPRR